MRTRENIISQLKAIKPALFSKYPIGSMALFGSAARGEANESSDIDILMEFNGSVGMRFFEVAAELEKHLQTKVDLVSKKGVKPKYFEAIKPDLVYV